MTENKKLISMQKMETFILLFIFVIGSDFSEGFSGECPKGMNCSLRLSCRGHEGSILTIHNPQYKSAIVIDSQSKTSMVSSGSLGFQFFYEDGKGYGIMDMQRRKFQSTQDYSSYIRNIQNINLRDVRGTKYPIRNPPYNVLIMHSVIIRTLQSELEHCEEIDKKTAYNILIILMKQLSDLKTNILRRIITEKLNSKEVLVEGGIMNVVSVFRGIARLIQFTNGEFERTILNTLTFQLEPLFIQESATEILFEIGKQINQPESKMYDVFQKPDKAFAVFKEFNGGSYSGMRGVESIALHTILFLKKRISLVAFIDQLILVTSFIKQISIETVSKKMNHIINVLRNRSPLSRSAASFFLRMKLNISFEVEFVIEGVDLFNVVGNFINGLLESRVSLILEILRRTTDNYISSVALLTKRLIHFQMNEKTLVHTCGVFPKKPLRKAPQYRSGISPEMITQRKILEQLKSIEAEDNMLLMKGLAMNLPIVREIFTEVESNLTDYNQWLDELKYWHVIDEVISLLESKTGNRTANPSGCTQEMDLWSIIVDDCETELI